MKKYLLLALACLIFSVSACEKKLYESASDPKHETTGDPNPTIKNIDITNKLIDIKYICKNQFLNLFLRFILLLAS